MFGHNFLGYLYFCIDDFKSAIKGFKKAVQLKADNCYAYCKLSRSYGVLYLKASQLDFRRSKYKKSAIQMLEKAQNVLTADTRRIGWLRYWLKKKGMVTRK